MNRINWTVTVEEANYILAALGARPFAEVAALLSKLKNEAEMQVKPVPPAISQPEVPAVN